MYQFLVNSNQIKQIHSMRRVGCVKAILVIQISYVFQTLQFFLIIHENEQFLTTKSSVQKQELLILKL